MRARDHKGGMFYEQRLSYNAQRRKAMRQEMRDQTAADARDVVTLLFATGMSRTTIAYQSGIRIETVRALLGEGPLRYRIRPKTTAKLLLVMNLRFGVIRHLEDGEAIRVALGRYAADLGDGLMEIQDRLNQGTARHPMA